MGLKKRRVIPLVLLLFAGLCLAPTVAHQVGITGSAPPPSSGAAISPSAGPSTPPHPLDSLTDLAFLDLPPIDGSVGNRVDLTDIASDNAYTPNGPQPFDFRSAFPDDWMDWAVKDLSSANALGLRVPSGGGGGGGGGGSSSGGNGGGGNGEGNGGGTPNSDLPPAVVPLPASVWLLGTSLLGLMGFARRQQRRREVTAVVAG